jgi:hypothetical protein
MTTLNRRDFLNTLGAAATITAAPPAAGSASLVPPKIKPLSGTWFEFQHHATVEGVDWNPECVRFISRQWEEKVKEIADVGMK